jgi:hypothetical protein
VRCEAGAAELVGLLDWIALGDEDEAVPGGELCKGGIDGGEKLDLMLRDGLGETDDALVLFGRDGGVGQLLETIDEGAAEAAETIAMGGDGGVFAVVEVFANLLGRVNAVIEVGDEGCDGTLEVDVVLPQGVICVDEQGLVRGAEIGWFEIAHMPIIGGA